MARCPHTMKAKNRDGSVQCCDCGKILSKPPSPMLEMARGVYSELGRGSARDIECLAKALDAAFTHGTVKGVTDTVAQISEERKSHKVMTPVEYSAMPLKGWHEVCRDVDGHGGVGVRFLGQ
jgi:hypothetical protein